MMFLLKEVVNVPDAVFHDLCYFSLVFFVIILYDVPNRNK